jgi:hypothetical protein
MIAGDVVLAFLCSPRHALHGPLRVASMAQTSQDSATTGLDYRLRGVASMSAR